MCFNMVFLCWKTIGDSVIWVAGDQREEFQIRVASEFSLSSCSMIDFIAKGRKIREWFLQLSLPVFSPKIGFSSKRSRITTNGTRISPSQKVPGWFLGNMDSFPGRATYTQSSHVWKEIPHRICTKKSLFQLRPAVEWSNKWEGEWNAKLEEDGMVPKHPGRFEEWQHSLYCYTVTCTSHKVKDAWWYH